MPLTAASPTYLHLLQNGSLILLSAIFFPLCTIIAILSWVLSPYLKVSKHIKHYRKWRRISSSTFRPRTVLVTGVGTSKGLALARIFYRAGHRVIGADFEPYYIPVCGHFSTSIEIFYRLSTLSGEARSARYIKDLLDIIKKEKVELWISSSEIGCGIEDGEAAKVIEKETKCKTIQFGLTLTEILYDKYAFIDHTRKLGLNVPDTHLVTSKTEALVVLYPEKPRSSQGKQYTMTSTTLDEFSRADKTLLPLHTLKESEAYVKRLNPTPLRPLVLQQSIPGLEYSTHSLIIKGKVKAFVACPSDRSMHIMPLPLSSLLSQAMLQYTTLYAKKTSSSMTGHLSLSFRIPSNIAEEAEVRVGVSDIEVKDMMTKIHAIEGRPTVNIAVVTFAEMSEDLAEAYLSILPDHEPKGISNGHRNEALVVPKPGIQGYYWIGHDLVTKVFLPILGMLRWERRVGEVVGGLLEYAGRVVGWREGVWEVWDPWPAWWVYGGYWPLMCTVALWEGRGWSHIDVTTGTMVGFE